MTCMILCRDNFYLNISSDDIGRAKLFIDTKYDGVFPTMVAWQCSVRWLIWVNSWSDFESLMSFKWHAVNKVKISTTFSNSFVLLKCSVIQYENRKSVENDFYMFIAILYRILSCDYHEFCEN